MSPPDFVRLVDTHAAALVLYARQWCDAPEDVVQEAFLKLVRQDGPPEDAVAWLYRVVRNAALDAAKMDRRRRRREAVPRPGRWFVELEVDGLDAETAVTALQRLPAEQREVIVARLWGGLSFEQVAEVAGCSASTAFRRYTAGVEDLRTQLAAMAESSFERLSRFTPDAGLLNRDALLFAAGRCSVRPNRAWKGLAVVLLGSQALSLFLLWPHPAPPYQASRLPLASRDAPRTTPKLPSSRVPPSQITWSAKHRLTPSETERRSAGDFTLIGSGPPLRAFPRLVSLLN